MDVLISLITIFFVWIGISFLYQYPSFQYIGIEKGCIIYYSVMLLLHLPASADD